MSQYNYMEAYSYCARALMKVYRLDIIEYGLEFHMSYVNGERTFNKDKSNSFYYWVFLYLRGYIRNQRRKKKDALDRAVQLEDAVLYTDADIRGDNYDDYTT